MYFPLGLGLGEDVGAGGMGPAAEVVEKRTARPGLKVEGAVEEGG